MISFLLTVCVGAIVQVFDHRRQAVSELVNQIDATADFMADRLDRLARSKEGRSGLDRRLQSELERVVPAWARTPGRQVLVANGESIIVAAVRQAALAITCGGTVATV